MYSKNVALTVSLLFSLTAGGLLCGCASSKSEDSSLLDNAKQKAKRKVVEVGKIATVNKEEQFVLIKMQYSKAASSHALLYVEAGDRKATLTPTGEKIGSFVAADITKGEVMPSDRVVALIFDTEANSPKPLTPLNRPSPDQQPVEAESEQIEIKADEESPEKAVDGDE